MSAPSRRTASQGAHDVDTAGRRRASDVGWRVVHTPTTTDAPAHFGPNCAG